MNYLLGYSSLSLAMPEEQGDAMEVPGVSQPEGSSLIGESHLGKVRRTADPGISFAFAVPFQVCCSSPSLVSSMV